jgi:hypothetical protein
MATCTSVGNTQTALSTVPHQFRRLFRAHVQPQDWRQPECTAFVEAGTHSAAVRKIAGAIAALEYRKPEEVQERIYNCSSAEELIAEGLSEDHALRLFETGWSDRVVSWVESPLVLLLDPAPLLKVWARITAVTS